MSDIALRVVYLANVFVAGQIGYSALFTPDRAVATVFQHAVAPSEGLRVVGALWLAIAVLSAAGLFAPRQFVVVLLLQLVYKASWLAVAGVPALRAGEAYPRGMFWFSVVWVAVLPWVIPWRVFLGGGGE